ncbi:hypothetical protein ACFQL4_06000 [Halosimplex aquaticum]
MVVALVLATVGSPATEAFYRNGAAGNQNAVQGGTLDLKLAETGPTNGHGSTTDESGADAVADTLEDLNHDALGAHNVTNTLTLQNGASSLTADQVDIAVDFAENDSDADDGNAANTASTLEVTAFHYAGTDLTASELTDENGNGILDVEDLTLGSNPSTLSGRTGIGVGGNRDLTIALSGSSDLISGVGSTDGVDITVTLTVRTTGFGDPDASTSNTIQYA